MTQSCSKLILLVGVAVSLMACEGGGECIDRDFDGFGVACAAGADCDDTNAERTDNCDSVPPPDCVASPSAAGCACPVGGEVVCFAMGVEDTQSGVGLCRDGTRECLSGYWGICRGAVQAEAEVCDGFDQDCDGEVDEGTRSPCGGCDDSCVGDYSDASELYVEESVEGLELGASGGLTLSRTTSVARSLWVPNTREDTVFGVDVTTGAVIAKHRVAYAQPRGVAVDRQGDAWVLSQGPGAQGGLTRIAGARERCEDRNGNGEIESWDGEGEAIASELDECILLSLPMGNLGDEPQALALGWDDVWVGLSGAEQLLRLDRQDGRLLQTVETPGFRALDGVFDSSGRLWMVSRGGGALRLTPGLEEIESEPIEVPGTCRLLEAVSVNPDGGLLFTGAACGVVHTRQPTSESWTALSVDDAPRGVVANDDIGWVSHSVGRVSPVRLRPTLRTRAPIDLHRFGNEPVGTTGLTTDELGYLWALSSHDAQDPDAPGLLTRIEIEGGRVVEHIPVGLGPEVQGDWSGKVWRRVFGEEGRVRRVSTGCPMGRGTRWIGIHLYGDEGVSGNFGVALRRGESVERLEDASFEALGSLDTLPGVLPLDLPDEGVIEVEVTFMRGARGDSPRLWAIGVQWECPGPV